jgi:hypothetical protein
MTAELRELVDALVELLQVRPVDLGDVAVAVAVLGRDSQEHPDTVRPLTSALVCLDAAAITRSMESVVEQFRARDVPTQPVGTAPAQVVIEVEGRRSQAADMAKGLRRVVLERPSAQSEAPTWDDALLQLLENQVRLDSWLEFSSSDDEADDIRWSEDDAADAYISTGEEAERVDARAETDAQLSEHLQDLALQAVKTGKPVSLAARLMLQRGGHDEASRYVLKSEPLAAASARIDGITTRNELGWLPVVDVNGALEQRGDLLSLRIYSEHPLDFVAFGPHVLDRPTDVVGGLERWVASASRQDVGQELRLRIRDRLGNEFHVHLPLEWRP